MFIAFGIEGVGIWALYMLGHDPVWFVVLSGLVFFAWGEIYSLFPSTCTDTFGSKFATTNAGLLYTAKGTAALLVPIANYMQQSSGRWDRVFLIAAGANILASLLAIAVLKPWRRRGGDGDRVSALRDPVKLDRATQQTALILRAQGMGARRPGADRRKAMLLATAECQCAPQPNSTLRIGI